MTPLREHAPAPACPGTYRGSCQRCNALTHRQNTNRTCDAGHQPYAGRGLCRGCFRRAYRACNLPTVVLIRHANRGPKRKRRTPVNLAKLPRAARGFLNSPCSRCGTIAPIPFGPGDGLCAGCYIGEQTDMATAETPELARA